MNNPEKSRHIDIEKELRRMQGVDLLSTPKKGLSLQDRLRRNRQVEATLWNQVTLPGFDRTKTQPSPTHEENVIPPPNKDLWITIPIFTADRRTLIREFLDKPSSDSKETIRKRRREEMDKKTIQLMQIATEALADASEILTDRDIDIFNAVQKGASNADLAELYGRTEAAMEWIVGKIRKKIEPYIERSGLLTFKTLSEKLHQDGLEVTDIDLFRFRLLPQVKIARKAYSTEEMAKWTIETTEGKMPAFFENFRLTPAKHSLSKSDYEIVHRSAQLKEFIIEVNGRHHILLDDIPQITSLLHPPSEEYLSLTDLAKTLPRTQKRKLQRAFQTGEIDGIKRRKEWMTTQEIFDEYLEKHSSNSKV